MAQNQEPVVLSLPSREKLLEQMAYLAAELQAQQAILGFIPDVAWDASPMPGSPSLRQMYHAMLARECEAYRAGLGLKPIAPFQNLDPEELLTSLASVRQQTVDDLGKSLAPKGTELQATDTKKLAFCYQITQNDATALREIGVRLSELQLVNHRVRRL